MELTCGPDEVGKWLFGHFGVGYACTNVSKAQICQRVVKKGANKAVKASRRHTSGWSGMELTCGPDEVGKWLFGHFGVVCACTNMSKAQICQRLVKKSVEHTHRKPGRTYELTGGLGEVREWLYGHSGVGSILSPTDNAHRCSERVIRVYKSG